MKDKVLQIVSEIAKKDVEELKVRYDERGVWNSLTRVEIIMTLEDEFDIEYTDEEIAQMSTPRLVVEKTLERINEA